MAECRLNKGVLVMLSKTMGCLQLLKGLLIMTVFIL